VNDEAEKNQDFKKLLEAVRESCRAAVNKVERELPAQIQHR